MLLKRFPASFRTVLVAGLSAGIVMPVTALASSGFNPLRDYYSAVLTNQFESTFPQAGEMTVNIDIPYGPDAGNTYDVYRPNGADDAPIIVMVHGGNWQGGDKADANVASAKAAYWVSRGYMFVSVNYRIGNDIDPLTQASDVATAIAKIQSKAADWGGDKSKMVLMGHGAGGHLAALLSANPSTAIDQGATPWKAAVILDSAALDVPAIMQSSHPDAYDQAFGDDSSYWNDASPKATLTSTAVPMLLVCSTENPLGSCNKAESFRSQALSKGAEASILPRSMAPDEISAYLGVDGDYTNAVDDFIRNRL